MVEIKDKTGKLVDDKAEKYVNGWRCRGIRNFLSTAALQQQQHHWRLVHGVTQENNAATTTTLQFNIILLHIYISYYIIFIFAHA